MKKTLFACIALALFTFCSCKDKDNDAVTALSSYDLKFDECVTFQQQGLNICFKKAEESRCPCNADCIWEGTCDVTLQVNGTGIDTTLKLSSNPSLNKTEASVGNFKVKLTKIVPEDCNDYEKYEKYVASIVVE